MAGGQAACSTSAASATIRRGHIMCMMPTGPMQGASLTRQKPPPCKQGSRCQGCPSSQTLGTVLAGRSVPAAAQHVQSSPGQQVRAHRQPGRMRTDSRATCSRTSGRAAQQQRPASSNNILRPGNTLAPRAAAPDQPLAGTLGTRVMRAARSGFSHSVRRSAPWLRGIGSKATTWYPIAATCRENQPRLPPMSTSTGPAVSLGCACRAGGGTRLQPRLQQAAWAGQCTPATCFDRCNGHTHRKGCRVGCQSHAFNRTQWSSMRMQ